MTDAVVPTEGVLVGRAQVPGVPHPLVVTVRDGSVVDITSKAAPTVRDVCEMPDPAGYVAKAEGRRIGDLTEALRASWGGEASYERLRLLSPIDLQAVKAAGVTFVISLLERVIEEQARGDKAKADALRGEILGLIGTDLSQLVPGSETAMKVKETLIARGVWSQYLEVGIGPDPEVFTKAQPMSTVGYGADVGVHPISTLEQPGARSRDGRRELRRDRRRDARQRRQPARRRGPLGAAPRQGQGQQRLGLARPFHPALRRRLHARRPSARPTSRSASKARTGSCSTANRR